MAICRQACPYNTFDGCKVKKYGGVCQLTNTAQPITEYRMTNADRIRSMSDEELAPVSEPVGDLNQSMAERQRRDDVLASATSGRMTMNKLKPCPFCGGKDSGILTTSYDGYWFAVFCENCMAHTRKCRQEKDAIEAWNRRANDGKAD